MKGTVVPFLRISDKRCWSFVKSMYRTLQWDSDVVEISEFERTSLFNTIRPGNQMQCAMDNSSDQQLTLEPLRIWTNECQIEKIKKPAIVYFFHGSGSNGYRLHDWLKDLCKEVFTFPHINVIFPHAPEQHYTLNVKREYPIWFDREALLESSDENKESVNRMCDIVLQSIEEEVAKGTPYNRIVIGGFSMGGALALHLAYRFKKPFAGCFAISSFLNHDSLVYQALDADCKTIKPPLLLLHGFNDALVPIKWTWNLTKKLGERGVDLNLKTYSNTDHEIIKEQVIFLREWLLKLLPPS